jgi:LmbE family N-acetylglucosaminyl deacetylase
MNLNASNKRPRTKLKFDARKQLTGINTALVVVAHPDDAEWGCGGTVAKLTDSGTVVHYLVATDGSQGDDTGKYTPKQLTAIRRDEQDHAAAMLGVKTVHRLNRPDADLVGTKALRGSIVAYIRRLRPQVVFTHDPSPFVRFDAGGINHSDHRQLGQATIDAFYPYARVAHQYPGTGSPYQVPTLMLFDTLEPNHWEDVSATAKLKIEALHAHASQFRWRMDDWIDSHMLAMGKDVGISRAEAFRRFDLS